MPQFHPSRLLDISPQIDLRSDSVRATARAIYGWMKQRSKLVFGHGKVDGSISACFSTAEGNLYPLNLYTQGKVYINFAYCYRPPFDDEAMRIEWLHRLNTVPGIDLPAGAINKMPGVPLTVLGQGDRVQQFLRVMDWFADQVPEVG